MNRRRFLQILFASATIVSLTPAASAEPAADEAPRSFPRRPRPGERAHCPVADQDFVVKADTAMARHRGRYYAFCCPGCRRRFREDPSHFAP